MGTIRARPEDDRGCHNNPAPHPDGLRARRAGNRFSTADGALDLRDHRCRPTGVELAGTIAELALDTLPPDFRRIDTRKARVVLIEAGLRVLPGYPEDLSAYAQRALEGLGVEVVLGKAVTECTADGVVYGDCSLESKTIICAGRS
jgi:hypothetical protein